MSRANCMPKITPARWVKSLLADNFGQTDVACVPNAVTQTFTAPRVESSSSDRRIYVYYPFRPKGCDVTIEAIRLARTRPDLKVIAFGSSQADTGDTPPGQRRFRSPTA